MALVPALRGHGDVGPTLDAGTPGDVLACLDELTAPGRAALGLRGVHMGGFLARNAAAIHGGRSGSGGRRPRSTRDAPPVVRRSVTSPAYPLEHAARRGAMKASRGASGMHAATSGAVGRHRPTVLTCPSADVPEGVDGRPHLVAAARPGDPRGHSEPAGNPPHRHRVHRPPSSIANGISTRRCSDGVTVCAQCDARGRTVTTCIGCTARSTPERAEGPVEWSDRALEDGEQQ